MRKLVIGMLLSLSFMANAISVDLDFYINDSNVNPNIPTPQQVLGYQVGDWHVRHDQLVNYYKALAAASDRVTVKTIGHSHENRELLHVTITSKTNHAQLAAIQANHLARLDASKKPNANEYPLVVNLNYSVHGDESSGSNASMLVAYYLAASNDKQVLDYLDNMVIILDPSLNPDGLSRFAQWANQHKGMNLNADPNNREHVQDWIRGRVNHYWFDLNRDWLLLQHPESRARIKEFHAWRPNVLTDHHEMGTDSTFFFQPGIPSRKNPHTPNKNVTLTKELANYHAKALDAENKLYFTEESFDDFYAGKGSTYPDLHGTIGILFEQASSRGHLQHSINGDLDFPTTIKNQVTVTLSTLEGSLANKNALLDFQYELHQNNKSLAKSEDYAGYVIAQGNDDSKFEILLSLLEQHQIRAVNIEKDITVDGKRYQAHKAVFVPLQQTQYRLIKSIFSTQTSFNDNTFYDVSSWNLAMAFNLDFAKVKSAKSIKHSNQKWHSNKLFDLVSDSVSYAIDWADFNTPGLVYELLSNDIQLRTALKPFTAETINGKESFAAGTMLVNAGLQNGDWYSTFVELVQKHNVPVSSIKSGLTPVGVDLGSRNMMPVTKPNVLMVGGFGINPYEAGETWYLLDRYLGFSPSIVEKRWLSGTDLSKYTHILLMDGSFSKSDEKLLNKLKTWTRAGGTIWAQKRAALWLAKEGVLTADTFDSGEMRKLFDTKELSYGDMEALGGKQRIAGAFFEAELDLSHPLTFGYQGKTLPLFKNATNLLLPTEKPFTTVAKYAKKPLLAGYADQTNVDKISQAAAVVAHKYGKGRVIGMTDNPNFRSIMYGSNRLLINAIYLSKGIAAN